MMEQEEAGRIEVEEYLQACPKCSNGGFFEESTEFFGIADRAFRIVCRRCGFSWKELYEFKYSSYGLED